MPTVLFSPAIDFSRLQFFLGSNLERHREISPRFPPIRPVITGVIRCISFQYRSVQPPRSTPTRSRVDESAEPGENAGGVMIVVEVTGQASFRV